MLHVVRAFTRISFIRISFIGVLGTAIPVAATTAVVVAACSPPGGGSSGGGGGGGTTSSSSSSSGSGASGNDPTVCITYDDQQANLPRCGVRGGGLDCGNMYSCTGICDRGPSCFARADCCADSCSAWGSNTVCGTEGTLNDNNHTVAKCDKGFAARHPGGCETANPDWTCCTSTAPSYLCPPDTRCAQLSGGGYCCTTATACKGLDDFCGDAGTCCNGLTCTDGRCRTQGFQCKSAGTACVLGSTDCCTGLRCMSLDGTSFMCMSSTPDQQM